VKIFQLWQTFIDNVNPLVKAIHMPTTQQLIIEASGNLEKIDKPIEALMFAIYHCAVASLRNEDCENMLGDSKAALLTKFSYAAQQALINAEVLRTSNLMVLQALSNKAIHKTILRCRHSMDAVRHSNTHWSENRTPSGKRCSKALCL